MLNIWTTSLLLLVATQTQASACTREYIPVCGRLQDKTQTFPNLCMLKKAGAVFVSEGECHAPSKRKQMRQPHIEPEAYGHKHK